MVEVGVVYVFLLSQFFLNVVCFRFLITFVAFVLN